MGPGLPRPDERRLRLRRLGPARAGALPRPRPLRRAPAVRRRAGRRPRLRLRAEGHPPPPGGPARARSGRPRRELHDLVHLAGRLVVPRHPRAGACALPPRRAGGHPRGAAQDLRFSDAPDVPPASARPSPRSSTPSRRRHAPAPARRRPRRRLPERRARLLGDRRARARADGRDALRLRIGFEDRASTRAPTRICSPAHAGSDLTRVTVGARDIAELLPQTVELAEKPTLRTAPSSPCACPAPCRTPGSRSSRPAKAPTSSSAATTFRENAVRHFWAREPESSCARFSSRAERLHRQGPEALGRLPRRLLPQGPDRDRRPALQPPASLRQHVAAPLLDGDVLAGAAERGDPAERLEARLPRGSGR